ncbi:ABC transporter ATP-binding protein [Brevibacillus humidisoli]|uniref:ABC transporter ATP-binding protein n=1 Tax=Brevibacillus humidisoli TaxID=2895522 RepID=UPI001E4B4EA5|nr:ABC transporter ATP-binding protein [Brevibacillus humidisoli]UFJ39519.1 ABC transporter ATP-binding protein [Brevibacillus humidisoli]
MIEVADLQYAYPGEREDTIKGIDFSIAPGEIFGFLGPSGAGKSTTQKVLIGMLKEYRGHVSVLKRELRSAGPDYYERIGVAFEFPNFYSKFTALENLQFFRSLYTGKTVDPRRLLARVGLERDAEIKVASYSKGMKMRLNFCRAFLNNPEIIFLDEPTSGLDPVNARIVKDFILEQKAAGKTIVITTHNMNAADELCDRVAFIVDGQVSLIDSPSSLKVKYGRKVVRVEYRRDRQLQTADFALDRLAENAQFLHLLSETEIVTMHTQEATLEDIFIDVTGRRLS